MINNRFFIFTPFFNVENWISNTIKIVKCQSYKNFKHILIDDLSTDNSYSKALNLIQNDNRFNLIKNNIKKYPLRNFYEQIKNYNLEDEDIIVLLDGDDWFFSVSTLEILNSYYNKTNCLMTYGSYIDYLSNKKGYWSKKIPEDVIKNNSIRKYEWSSSHLKTFKYKVWKEIKEEDLKDSNDNFYNMTADLAIMFPMLEMCGDRSLYIDDILYVYNSANPINEHKVNVFLQQTIEHEIRNKKPYNKIF